MFLSFCRKLTLFAMVVTFFVACSKENSDPSVMLMKKTWSPHQVEIHTTDSNTVVVTNNSNGQQTKTSTVLKSDTIYTVSDCQQNSIYQFGEKNQQVITDACTAGSSDYKCVWTLENTKKMVFSQFVTGLITVEGSLSEVNSSQFVFTTDRNLNGFGNSLDSNGNTVSTTDILSITTTITFKSR
jgi:hypothetical protein